MAALTGFDRRRINGPEESFAPIFELEGESSGSQSQASSSSQRQGRQPTDIRPIFLQPGLINQANGSAYIETEKTKVACAVYGPRQSKNTTYNENGRLNVEVKFTPFSCSKRKAPLRDAEDRGLAVAIHQALLSSVRLELLPKSTIDIFIMIIEADGMEGSASPFPSTPQSNRSRSIGYNDYKPLNSSPLTMGSSPTSSPIQQAQARRKSQYKARTSSASVSSPAPSSETGSLLRERFKSTCLQRARNARKKIVKNKRRLDPMSSDGFDEEMDEDLDEDDFEDEILRRVMLNEESRRRHRYRLSYYATCGDSIDPDLEDVGQWEEELQEEPPNSSMTASTSSQQPQTPKKQSTTFPSSPMEPTFEDLEDAELEAYAEEYERQAALAEFEDIPIEELLGLDDEDLDDLHGYSTERNDVAME
ncbi:hypothetical protein VNI00_003286 [Paramarasmius palmivorus]|uniref:Exoribonuclease phosphorolytic domain-containing protein n=1 Tax=Paramarasmius palmivorus TaxID=297713 RepID=A0AAW0DQ47_9AGAR